MTKKKLYNRFRKYNYKILAKENCRIFPRRIIIYGEVNLECSNIKNIGNTKNSYDNFVATLGECRVINNATKEFRNKEVPLNIPKEGKFSLSNIEGLKFRSERSIINKKIVEKIDTLLDRVIRDSHHFSCGCVIDDKKLRRDAERYYIPLSKNDNVQYVPTLWIKKYVKVDDKIFDNKVKWMPEDEYNLKLSILNDDERENFKKTGGKALACVSLPNDETSSSRIVSTLKHKQFSPLIFIKDGKIIDKKGKELDMQSLKKMNLDCDLKSYVPNSVTSENAKLIPIEKAKKIFKGNDFSVESYYDPKHIDKEVVRRGFQCKYKNNYVSTVSIKFQHP